MDDEAKPYLLTEASGLTGLSVDALRKRIERKKLRGSRSNEDGQWRVWLTSRDVETAKSGRIVDKPGQDVDVQSDESRTIKALDAEAAALRERVGRAEGESATLRERMESERGRADQAEARAGRAEAERDAARAEREAAKVAAASAEGEARGLREALAEARRPFWRRWLG
jgi:chromosome segregation ATPase